MVKRFGSTTALAGVDLEVPEGTVFGLLGPNGAGKTTLVRILATLLEPDAGTAELVGHDVVTESAGVSEVLALTGQFAAVDELLTGRENLAMFGRLLYAQATEAADRSAADRLGSWFLGVDDQADDDKRGWTRDERRTRRGRCGSYGL